MYPELAFWFRVFVFGTNIHSNFKNNEMIKELKKRNPVNGGPRLRSQQPKKEINIEDLIEGKFYTLQESF